MGTRESLSWEKGEAATPTPKHTPVQDAWPWGPCCPLQEMVTMAATENGFRPCRTEATGDKHGHRQPDYQGSAGRRQGRSWLSPACLHSRTFPGNRPHSNPLTARTKSRIPPPPGRPPLPVLTCHPHFLSPTPLVPGTPHLLSSRPFAFSISEATRGSLQAW